MKCVICNKKNTIYQERDWSTGFVFCESCMEKTKEIYFNKIKKLNEFDEFACWLHSIAEAREATK